jgi:hypothetical protein
MEHVVLLNDFGSRQDLTFNLRDTESVTWALERHALGSLEMYQEDLLSLAYILRERPVEIVSADSRHIRLIMPLSVLEELREEDLSYFLIEWIND